MKKLLFLLLVLTAFACQKQTTQNPNPQIRPDFFSGQDDVNRTVALALDKEGQGAKLQKIQSISYLDSGENSWAILAYQTDRGNSNLVIKKETVGDGSYKVSTIKCDGASCDCLVRVVIGNDGGVTVGCNCSSCTMLINP